jgi:hypothetical protein
VSAWERLVRGALLGTERQGAPDEISAGDPDLDAAIAALSDRPAPARLLGTAALLDAWRRAGRRAGASPAPLDAAPEVEERPCSARAASVLRQLLAGAPPPLLAEWLTLARTAAVAVPPELLPDLLTAGVRHAEVRDDVDRGISARGRWLAALNPAWAYASGGTEEAAEGWETGTSAERLRILRHLRRTDPPAGLALVRATWTTDEPRDRAAFVEALAVGVGMDDEPFLESALDDRRKEVRTAAATVLGSLPGSGLVRRMTERLLPRVSLVEPDGLLSRIRAGQPRIQAALPTECDKSMRRDGIEPKPPYGMGERAWWLRQMLARVPPSFWAAHWGRPAADLLAAARASEEGQTLVSAWTDATVNARDAEWAEARLRTAAGQEHDGLVAQLAALVPPERLEPLALERLARDGLNPVSPAAQILQAAAFPWGPALTRAVLKAVPAVIGPFDYGMREVLRAAALRMHPQTAIAVLHEKRDAHEGPWVELLHLRHTLHQAFE